MNHKSRVLDTSARGRQVKDQKRLKYIVGNNSSKVNFIKMEVPKLTLITEPSLLLEINERHESSSFYVFTS